MAIRISDMLNGREFKHKSLTLMARRERQMVWLCPCISAGLEKLKEWEGTRLSPWVKSMSPPFDW